MNIQDKLNFINAIELEGSAPLSDVFAQLGRNDQKQDYRPFGNDPDYKELKTTSVRLDVVTLEALDAISKRFDLSRTEAFQFAVQTFFDACINGYAYGIADVTSEDNKVKVYIDARENLIKSLECSVSAQHEIRSSTHNDAMKKAKDFVNVAD